VGSMIISISMLTKDESTSQVYSNEYETSSAFAISILPTKNNPNLKTTIKITTILKICLIMNYYSYILIYYLIACLEKLLFTLLYFHHIPCKPFQHLLLYKDIPFILLTRLITLYIVHFAYS